MKLPRIVPTKHFPRPSTNYAGEPQLSNNFFTDLVPAAKLSPQSCGCNNNSTTATSSSPGYIYAYGSIRAKFPSLSVEKEFYQAVDEQDIGVHEEEVLYFKVLSKAENLYIAREMCWVLRIDGVDSYIVIPKSETELTELIAALNTTEFDIEFDVVMGKLSATSVTCNDLSLPAVIGNQIYSVSRIEFIIAVEVSTQTTNDIALELVNIMFSYADNIGISDEDRALNFVALRYMGAYKLLANVIYPLDNEGQRATTPKYQLIRLHTEASRVRGGRNILNVIFSFQNLITSIIQKWYCEVDVTSEFPFLVTTTAPYYQR
jgi:hypothetical protein